MEFSKNGKELSMNSVVNMAKAMVHLQVLGSIVELLSKDFAQC